VKLNARGFTFDVALAGPVDGQPILLLHGFPQNKSQWDRLLPHLHGAGFTTIAPDQRGYSPGARPSNVEAYAIGECVADIVAILDVLGLDSVDVVGHDWGAIVGWHLAAEHPDRVRTYTAVSVPHVNAMNEAMETDDDQKAKSSYVGLFRQAGKAEDLLLADDGARIRTMFAGCPEEDIDGYVAPMLDRAALTAALNWYRAMTRTTMQAGPVGVPTTFVWGVDDGAIGATAAHSCAKYVTGEFEFIPLDGISHWVPDQAPEELAAAVLSRVGAV
jgi:pimeloyl-ACP methyl ester carboxylesterase